VESVKAVEELKSPVTGKVLESNILLVDTPEQIAADPYGAAWLIRVRIDVPDQLDQAMTAAEYRSQVEGT
jgi:glycine cleavage system H protein